MSDRIDIADPVQEILRRLEIDPDVAASLRLVTPTQCEVTVYLKTADGKFHIGETGETATEVREFKVSTW